MGRPPGWAAALTGRAVMRSPGRPPVRRDLERAFWTQIAAGLTTEHAAVACGVSVPVGTRWFRNAGGMSPIELVPVSGRYLSFTEREDIAVMRAQGVSMRRIAIKLKRAPSTISRELRRNAATRNGTLEYRASTAQWKADLAARRSKAVKLFDHERLREYVQDKLSGVLRDENGDAVGPFASWKGRNKPRRADRRWATAWSPQQIAHRMPIDFPDDDTMRISHEAIYQSLYIEGRGALERALVACLRTGRALRKPRARAKKLRTGFITDDVTIGARPDEVDTRHTAGHWEGDLIIGLNRSAVGTVVERTSRFTTLLHLPRKDGYGTAPVVKNGPALSGYATVVGCSDNTVAPENGVPQAARTGVAPVNGMSMHFATYGDDKRPVVLLLHGGLADSDVFRKQIAAFSKSFYVVTVDSRGHGRSNGLDKQLSYHLMASDVESLLDFLGVDKVNLVGWSDGGIIGLDMAINHPERLSSLVVYGANYSVDGARDDTADNPRWKAYVAQTRADYLAIGGNNPAGYDELTSSVNQMWSTEPNYTIDQLRGITTRMLVLDGMTDEAVKQAHTVEMAAAIPNANLYLLGGVGHFAPVDKPGEFNRAVMNFLNPDE